MIIENGNAATIIVFCNAMSPPEYKSTIAMEESNIPQITFIRFEGLGFPFRDIMDKTYVPESADVTKNITTKIMATIDIIIPKG